MSRPRKKTWTLAEMAEKTGIPPRTIRYWISRGLLAGPAVAGRRASYGRDHLERLGAIRRLQDQGLTLAEIAREIEGPGKGGLPDPVPWQSFAAADDVVVLVRGDAPPWRLKKVREALADFASRVERKEGGSDDSDVSGPD